MSVDPEAIPSAPNHSRGGPPLPLLATVALAAAYALLFGWLSLERYWTFQMHALDMGNMGQAAWNTVHGYPFYFTNMRPLNAIEAWGTTTRLSFHVEALFPLISAVYLLYPHPESLLVLQTLALASGAVGVYLLGRDVTRRQWLPVAFAAVYLLFPTLEGMNLYEFHPVALATPLLLFAFLFAWRRSYIACAACCVAAVGTKEEIGLVVAMFGLYIALANRDWRPGLSLVGAGVFWSLFAALVVEHHFRAPGATSYVHTRYKYLGHGLHGALSTILHRPLIFWSVLHTWSKAGYVNQLLVAAGYLPIFAAPLLALGLPTLAINLLSVDFHMYTGLGDNSAELVSVVMIAAMLGARVALDVLGRALPGRLAAVLIACYLVGVALWNQHVNGFTPLGARWQVPTMGTHQRAEEAFVGMVPAGAPVSTQDELDPALSSRHYLYLFPDMGDPSIPGADARAILLDASGPVYPIPSAQLHDVAMQYIARPEWGISAAADGLILIEKGARHKRIPLSFYSYLHPAHAPAHRLRGAAQGLALVGYDVARTDLPNHRVPNLAYSFYLRATHRLKEHLEPILYEIVHSRMVNCDSIPLGLAWRPTTEWKPGQTMILNMLPFENAYQGRGVVSFVVAIQRVPRSAYPTCQSLWQARGHLTPVGRQVISF
jgi:uncharacterized membrane protein